MTGAFALLLLAAGPASAPAAMAAGQEQGGTLVVAAETPVVLELTEPIGSRHSKTLQRFALRLAEPILVDGRVAVPAGAPAVGEIVHAARAGTKPGELILAARYIDVGTARIPLHKTRFSHTGASRSTTIVGGPGLISWSTSGDNIKLPVGFRLPAFVTAATAVPPALAPRRAEGDPGPRDRYAPVTAGQCPAAQF